LEEAHIVYGAQRVDGILCLRIYQTEKSAKMEMRKLRPPK
jgi:hypothetical protein